MSRKATTKDTKEANVRPFYGEYAWAYSLIIDRPVQAESRAVAAWFSERGVLPPSSILDAGCGNGRYALELSRRGYAVHGIDGSTDFIREACRSAAEQSLAATFVVQ